jgi:transcriptional regulator with XRE-family HTH domain
MRVLDPTRATQVTGGSLTELLRKYADRVMRVKGKTQAQVARDAWLDESYVSRLLTGERDNPSRDALLLLTGWGLELAVEEVDELLMAADYKPLVLPASIR